MRRTALLLALIVSGLLAANVGAAERFKRHTVRGEGVSLTVPASWVAADSRLPKSTVERISRENPRLAPFMQGLADPSSPVKFLALDPAVRQGFATNVNVVAVPLAGGITFGRYRQAYIAEIRSIVGNARIDQRVVTVAGARALRVSYPFRIRLGRSYTVRTLQYAFLRPGRSVVVTYTTLPSSADDYAATFARSSASIRFR